MANPAPRTDTHCSRLRRTSGHSYRWTMEQFALPSIGLTGNSLRRRQDDAEQIGSICSGLANVQVER